MSDLVEWCREQREQAIRAIKMIDSGFVSMGRLDAAHNRHDETPAVREMYSKIIEEMTDLMRESGADDA